MWLKNSTWLCITKKKKSFPSDCFHVGKNISSIIHKGEKETQWDRSHVRHCSVMFDSLRWASGTSHWEFCSLSLSLAVQKHTLSYCRTFSFRSQNTDVLLFGVQLLVTNAPFCLQLISALFLCYSKWNIQRVSLSSVLCTSSKTH